MWHLLRTTTLAERILLAILTLVIIVSTAQIGQAFYIAHSAPVPGDGGTYVEGVTGNFQFLNPVLAQTDLDRDVTSLVACGLTRYDPITATVVDDVATHLLSPDQRTYTFTLRDGVTWHDGEPITADDLIFTFREVIQHPDFPNKTLAHDFANVSITRVDDRTITMTLARKYAFFIYATSVGLVPKHLFATTPVKDILTSPLNQQPVGCGPYRFENATGNQIRLSAFEKYHRGTPHLDTFVFRIFDDEDQLYRSLDGITGTKNLSATHIKTLRSDARLAMNNFTLPQYVALFFNIDRPILKNKTTRLALQLATDKDAIIKSLGGNATALDTPLLEISDTNWKYAFSAERADGALYDAGWRYGQPTPAAAAAPTVTSTTNDTTAKWITQPTSARFFATDQTNFFVSGTAPAGTTAIIVNGYQIKKYDAGKPWTYRASTSIGTMKAGENEYVVEAIVGGVKHDIDRVTIFQSGNAAAREMWMKTKNPTTTAVAPAPTPAKVTPTPKVDDKLRRSVTGQTLAMKLLVPAEHAEFMTVAKEVQKTWAARGVALTIDAVPQATFVERLDAHDYDIVLFGQNLGYDLDAYSFWHSSEARAGGGNLSNLKSIAANTWLEQIRSSFDTSERRRRLEQLKTTLADEVPAVVLYTPTYAFAVDKNIHHFNLGKIALRHDRFANASEWYMRESRALTDGTNVWTAVKWFFTDALTLPFASEMGEQPTTSNDEKKSETSTPPATPMK